MKTAISIPDETFRAAERLARRLQLSRSELYSRAVLEYVDEHRRTGVTEKLNEIYAGESSSADTVWLEAQAALIADEDW